MNDLLAYQLIFNYLRQEEAELNILGEGIFFAPELYISFGIGKLLKQFEKVLFENAVKWQRETSINGNGPADLILEPFVFEIKLRQTSTAYARDIEKLSRLQDNYKKYFVALIDCFEKDDVDPRIEKIEKEYPQLIRVTDFQSFSTKAYGYNSKIKCVLAIWKLP